MKPTQGSAVPATAAAALVLAIIAAVNQTVVGYDNGYGLKPFLGWQSWCAVGSCGTDACFDRQIRATAQAMVDSGMKALGFEWVVIDDCWHPTRDANGTLVPHPAYFPHGIKPVADFVHSLGLKFGLCVPPFRHRSPREQTLCISAESSHHTRLLRRRRYTSVGTLTCHHGWSPGSFGHYEQDAQLFASWGVDVSSLLAGRLPARRCHA